MKTFERSMELSPPLHPILGIAFLNFIFLFLSMVVFFSFFAVPSGLELRMPTINSGNALAESHVTIRITSENILYFNEHVVTLNDLKRELPKVSAGKAIYLHVDRRSSMGRVADVWDLCKGLGSAKVRVIASQEN